MSGAVKSVKKVFKKSIKTFSKVAPIAIGVAAVVFTAGSAFGALPSWGTAVQSLTGSSTLGNIMAGAVTQAGYGAAIGMAGAALTGGNITKGAQYGAAAGAVTGGISGAAGLPTDPLAKSAGPATGGVASQGAGTAGIPMQTAAGAAPAAAATAMGDATGAGAMAPGGWLERNGELVGGLLKGVGEGWVRSGEADEEGKSQIKILRERNRQIADNYRGQGNGLLRDGDTDYIPGLGPTSPSLPFAYEYVYNPESGRIEKVATA